MPTLVMSSRAGLPEPAAASRGSPQHEGRAAVQIRLAVRALEIGIENRFFKLGVAGRAIETCFESIALCRSRRRRPAR